MTDQIDHFHCLACDRDFDKPSFSEGPKTKNPETGVEDVRFKLAKCLCPHCLSSHIEPVVKRCDYTAGSVRCCRPAGHSMEGMEGGHRYKCSGEFCPGLGWPASNTPHPTSCVHEHLNRGRW